MAKLFWNFKNPEAGITLVELIVVVFVIALFSSILISDFPKIQKQFALSRAAYNLAENLRKTEEMALSGVQVTDVSHSQIAVEGYGVYINLSNAGQYIIYADVAGASDRAYNGDTSYSSHLCNKTSQTTGVDCVVEIIDLSKENSDLYIKSIDTGNSYASINFTPPNPIITILPNNSETGIVLGLKSDNSATRTVSVNTSGLIKVNQ